MTQAQYFIHRDTEKRASIYGKHEPIIMDRNFRPKSFDELADANINNKAIRVKDLKTGIVYPSIKAAAAGAGCTENKVANHIRGNGARQFTTDINATEWVQPPKKYVYDDDTGERYETITDAARATGISNQTIYNQIHGITVRSKRFRRA